jgi:SRSO17 transposase
LAHHEHPFVLAVKRDEPLWAVLAGRWGIGGHPRADVSAAAQIPAAAWQRLSAAERRWDHWLLVRRSRSDPTELAYSVVFAVVFAPAGTSLRTLARVAGHRWRSEQSFERAKGEVGLDQDEGRRWDGWYRHMTLAMVALASLAVLRAHLHAQQAAQQTPASPRHRSHTTSKSQVAKGGHTSSWSM